MYFAIIKLERIQKDLKTTKEKFLKLTKNVKTLVKLS